MIVMKWKHFLAVLMPALAVACAQAPMNDSEEPGSAIVFPKFERGKVAVGGAVTPRTEFELGAVCPVGSTCSEHQLVRIRMQWVCPGRPTDSVCLTVDFDVPISVNGKVFFDTEGSTIPSIYGNILIPMPICPNGYLIGWVIDNLGRPVKFDGLFGDAVVGRQGGGVASYAAIPIQADPALANYNGANYNAARIAPGQVGTDPYILPFDGGNGHFRAVAGGAIADVEFNNDASHARTETSLILLTLDAQSERVNNPTFAFLDFYNQNERLLSTYWKFVCWTQISLTAIDPNLTQQLMGTRKGIVVARQAVSPSPDGTADNYRAVTLLGLVQTDEVPKRSTPKGASDAPGSATRGSGTEGSIKIFKMFNNGQPVPTSFVTESGPS